MVVIELVDAARSDCLYTYNYDKKGVGGGGGWGLLALPVDACALHFFQLLMYLTVRAIICAIVLLVAKTM